MAQQTLNVTLTLVVNSVLVLTTTALPAATVGQVYSFQLVATGGVAPYTWSASGLPTGLTCSTGGLISGVPTVSGSFSVTVTVSDSGT